MGFDISKMDDFLLTKTIQSQKFVKDFLPDYVKIWEG